ncbi:MAG TPA: hypothetical protein VFT55_04575, partial [Planctomycetota bacterium]|nr:hypothetical protein [Planctomycetota bacterium]
VAVPSRQGPLRLELRAGSAPFAFHLPAGQWRVEAEPAGSAAVVEVGPDPDPSGAVSVPEPGQEVVATLRATDSTALPLAVERIVFVRTSR